LDKYTGLFGKLVIIGTNRLLYLLLFITYRLETPEKHQDLLPASRTPDLLVVLGVDIIHDALSWVNT